MKLRIKGNTIRLRLTRPEVTRIAREGWLDNHTDFGTQTFRFALIAQDTTAGLAASYDKGSIVVIAPRTKLLSWSCSDEVGLYGEQPTTTGSPLTIAIEKDFRCLDRSRAEADEADAYPHPIIKSKGVNSGT